MNEIIERRIRFLLDAAKHEIKKDQVVTYAMRVLSNHATIGKDAGSAEIKKQNKTISEGAKKTSPFGRSYNLLSEHNQRAPKTYSTYLGVVTGSCRHSLN